MVALWVLREDIKHPDHFRGLEEIFFGMQLLPEFFSALVVEVQVEFGPIIAEANPVLRFPRSAGLCHNEPHIYPHGLRCEMRGERTSVSVLP